VATTARASLKKQLYDPDLKRERESLPLGEFVYKRVRGAIQDGVYPPGSRLREEEIAQYVGVSRTPVREALRLLHAHGLVENTSGRGLAVTELDRGQVLELYAMRELLEGAAARLAAQFASRPEIEALEHALDACRGETSDPALAARANRAFHEVIYQAAHNRYLVQSLDRLSDALALLPRTTYEVPGRAEAAAEEHLSILNAIAARDPDAAEQHARHHIQEARRHRIHLLFSR